MLDPNIQAQSKVTMFIFNILVFFKIFCDVFQSRRKTQSTNIYPSANSHLFRLKPQSKQSGMLLRFVFS